MATSSPHSNQKKKPDDSGSFGMPEKAFALSFCATVDAGELKPGIEAVARYFGGSRYSADSETKERIGAAIDQACRIASPMMTIAINPIKPSVLERTLKLPGGQSLPLPDCAGDLSVRYLAAAIGTLGKELEMECRHLAAQHRIYQSTLLDAVGTAMLEAMDTNICTRIDAESHPLGLCSGVQVCSGPQRIPHGSPENPLSTGRRVFNRRSDECRFYDGTDQNDFLFHVTGPAGWGKPSAG